MAVLVYIPARVVEGPHHVLPHPHWHLLSLVFLMVAILTGVRWDLNEVLILISLMAKAAEHF